MRRLLRVHVCGGEARGREGHARIGSLPGLRGEAGEGRVCDVMPHLHFTPGTGQHHPCTPHRPPPHTAPFCPSPLPHVSMSLRRPGVATTMCMPVLRIWSACVFMSTPPMASSERSSGKPSAGLWGGRVWMPGGEAGRWRAQVEAGHAGWDPVLAATELAPPPAGGAASHQHRTNAMHTLPLSRHACCTALSSKPALRPPTHPASAPLSTPQRCQTSGGPARGRGTRSGRRAPRCAVWACAPPPAAPP